MAQKLEVIFRVMRLLVDNGTFGELEEIKHNLMGSGQMLQSRLHVCSACIEGG